MPEVPKIKIQQLDPEDRANLTQKKIYFSVNVTNDGENLIENVSINIFNSTDVSYTQTNASGIKGIYNFSVSTLPDGSYSWNVTAIDNESEQFKSETRTFTLDSTPPEISLPNYQNETPIGSDQNLTLEILVTDNLSGPDSCFVDVNGTNQSIAFSDGWCNGTISLSNTPEGQRTLNVYANDSFGNWGLNNSYTVVIDDSPPNITINKPTGTYSSVTLPYDVFLEEISSFDLCTAWIMRGASVEVANTTQICPNGSSGSVTGTLTVSGDASYTFFFFANDSLGNSAVANSTFIIDTTASPTPSGGGGGGGGSIVQDVSTPQPREQACIGLRQSWFITWQEVKEDPIPQKIFAMIRAFWEFIVCGSAGSIVPI